MSLILCIETATAVCSVGLSREGELIDIREAEEKNSHSVILSSLIEELLQTSSLSYFDLDAVALSSGPGSYTGLRIGVSTAKGICYAIEKPMIAIGTLEALAYGAKQKHPDFEGLFCPMIDARRMEVYSCILTNQLEVIRPIQADILVEGLYEEYWAKQAMLFFGDGSIKAQEVYAKEGNVFFDTLIQPSSSNLAYYANAKFIQQDFVDVAYFEPFYLKDFIAAKPSVKGLY